MPYPICINCDIVQCCKFFEKDIRFCLCPSENKNVLIDDLKKLSNKKEVIECRVNGYLRTLPTHKCKDEVEIWFREVNELYEEVEKLFESDSNVSGCLFWYYCKSNRKFGQRISEMIKLVERLYNEGEKLGSNSPDLVELAPPQRIEDVQSSTDRVIGIDEQIDKLLCHLDNKDAQIIGIHGAAGIGKTTLMTELNNILLKRDSYDYDYVIWTTVSRDVVVHKIQDQIGRRMSMQLPFEAKERSEYLFKFLLSDKKFLFLIDDVWSKLDFNEIGIPIPHYKRNCKVIFTTRFLNVCHDMDAKEILHMLYLDWEKSWELFCMNLDGKVDLSDRHILSCARALTRECCGLPLALKVVAKAVRIYSSLPEWQDAVQIIERSPSDVKDVEDKLFNILKLSLHNLKDENLELCLLYCSLYPEDYDIHIGIITGQWLAEGFLDDGIGYRRSYEFYKKKGLSVVSTLKSACLVEKSPLGDNHFRMHDIVRDMCLWMTNYKSNKENTFEVWNSSTIMDSTDEVEKWERASKVSCVDSNFQCSGTKILDCPKLATLLLCGCKRIEGFHHGFFQFMPALLVLDLCDTRLNEVPTSIRFLGNLRYLNLSRTKINDLPKEVGELARLRQLYLYDTHDLIFIPKEALSRLGSLEKLDMCPSNYDWSEKEKNGWTGSSFQLQDFIDLKKLVQLHIRIHSKKNFEFLISTPFFHKNITQFHLNGCDFHVCDVINATRTFSYLNSLLLTSCYNITDIVFYGRYLVHLSWICFANDRNLSSITFEGEEKTSEIIGAPTQYVPLYIPFGRLEVLIVNVCPFKDLSFVKQLPSLTNLSVDKCDGLQSILPVDDEEPSLQKLQFLKLESLKNLSNICGLSTCIPSLTTLRVLDCPELRRLPFRINNCKLQQILGTKDWWDELQWENQILRTYLRSYFKPLYINDRQ